MIAITSWIQSNGGWTLTWNTVPGALFYRIVLYGKQLATNLNALTYTYPSPSRSTFPPPIEVTTNNALALSEQFKPFLVIQWYGEGSAASLYLIQAYNGTSWNTLASLQEAGQWVYTYTTGLLQDETIYQFRVVSQDSLGNQGPARNYQIFVVTPPTSTDGQVSIGYTKPNIVIATN